MGSFIHSVEILTQVFMHLDIPSVLAVRLSCKTFHSVTKTRQFWYNCINQLIKTNHVSPPEENLDEYNVDELEQWVRRRRRACDAFANPLPPSFREQTLDLGDFDLLGAECASPNSKLIPGGRWLLIGHPPAIVHFIDLDSPDPLPRLLFDFAEVDDEIREIWSEEVESFNFSIWIDRGSPRLSFRLAFSLLTCVSRIYISQVNLVGHGANATLVASNIAILRNPNLDMWPMCTALNDSYVVQAWNLEDDLGNTRFGVYDYRQTLCGDYLMSESDERPIVVTVFENDMEFISKNVFAMCDIESRSLLIYEIEPAASLNLLHRVDVHAPLWSTVRWTPGASIITMMNLDGTELRGVVIPHDSSHPPTTVVLGRCRGKSSHQYTLGTRVFVVEGKGHQIFRYDWDFNSRVNYERTLTSRRVNFSAYLLPFDEDIGRFLAYTDRMKLVIYDII